MRKLNNRKKTGVKKGVAKFGAGMFYIKTTGIRNPHRTKAVIDFEDKFKIPHKEKALSAGELGRMEDRLGGVKLSKIVIMLDQTSKQFKEWAEETTLFTAFLEIALNIDGDIKAYEDENGNEQTVWENLGIPKNSYVGLVEYLLNSDDLAMEMEDVTVAEDEIKRIKMGEETYAEIELKLDEVKEEIRSSDGK